MWKASTLRLRRSYAPHFVSLDSRSLVTKLEVCFVFWVIMRNDGLLIREYWDIDVK